MPQKFRKKNLANKNFSIFLHQNEFKNKDLCKYSKMQLGKLDESESNNEKKITKINIISN
jgi:hypothetical protein